MADSGYSIPASGESIPARPRRLTQNYKRELRKRAEAALEQLIDLINELDGDPDLEPIGNIPPAEAEQLYYAALDNLELAA